MSAPTWFQRTQKEEGVGNSQDLPDKFWKNFFDQSIDVKAKIRYTHVCGAIHQGRFCSENKFREDLVPKREDFEQIAEAAKDK